MTADQARRARDTTEAKMPSDQDRKADMDGKRESVHEGWVVTEDEEFGNPLLRWQDGPCIAQVLIEDEDIGNAAYAALVAAVEAYNRPRRPAGWWHDDGERCNHYSHYRHCLNRRGTWSQVFAGVGSDD